MPALHEMQIITELQRNTPLGNALKKQRGLMMIEKVSHVVVIDTLKSLAWFNEMKLKSTGQSKTSRELFRAKKYSFSQLPIRT